jgi:hypothetical protein
MYNFIPRKRDFLMGKIFGNQYFYKKRILSSEFLYKFVFFLTEKKICATMRMFIIFSYFYE